MRGPTVWPHGITVVWTARYLKINRGGSCCIRQTSSETGEDGFKGHVAINNSVIDPYLLGSAGQPARFEQQTSDCCSIHLGRVAEDESRGRGNVREKDMGEKDMGEKDVGVSCTLSALFGQLGARGHRELSSTI